MDMRILMRRGPRTFRFAIQSPFPIAWLQSEPAIERNLPFLSEKPTETVEAQRRRRSSGPSGRAEMPGRGSQSGGGGGTMPPSAGGGMPSFGGPGGLRGLPVGVVVLLLVCYFLFRLVSGGGSPSDVTGPVATQPQPPQQQV